MSRFFCQLLPRDPDRRSLREDRACVGDLEEASGTHVKHLAFRDPLFLRLIARLRENERRFLKKERIWRTVGDVHAAAIKAISANKRLVSGSVRMFMENPGSLNGPLGRSYLRWMKRRCQEGDQSVLRPKCELRTTPPRRIASQRMLP